MTDKSDDQKFVYTFHDTGLKVTSDDNILEKSPTIRRYVEAALKEKHPDKDIGKGSVRFFIPFEQLPFLKEGESLTEKEFGRRFAKMIRETPMLTPKDILAMSEIVSMKCSECTNDQCPKHPSRIPQSKYDIN